MSALEIILVLAAYVGAVTIALGVWIALQNVCDARAARRDRRKGYIR